LFTADHAVCEVLLRGAGGTCLGFGRKRNVPKSVGCISFSFDNYFPVFNDIDVVFGEESDAVVVTELAD
jgi:hypothetical protein